MARTGIPQLYVDGVENIRLSNGVLRMDLHTLIRDQGDEREETEVVQRLLLSLPAFLRLAGAVNATLEQMQQQGIVTRREGDGQAQVADGAPLASPANTGRTGNA